MRRLFACLLALVACATPTAPAPHLATGLPGTYTLQAIGVHALPFDGVSSDILTLHENGTWEETRNAASYQRGAWVLTGSSLTLAAGTAIAYGGMRTGEGMTLYHGTFAYTFTK